MVIALVMLKRCTAACGHCSTNCGPRRTELMSGDELRRVMTEVAAVDDGQELYFHLTGGEPFFDFDSLLATVSHGGALGAALSCTTNAFWARSEAVAMKKLILLRDAGLRALAVSTSRFHERFVPLRNVEMALRAATRIGLNTELKGAVTKSDFDCGSQLERWRQLLDADTISIFPVIPYLREGASLPEHEYIRDEGLPVETCPTEVLTIDADGTAMSCCGQASQSRFVALGNVRESSISALKARLESSPRQRVLREKGPIAFARAAIAAGRGHLLREGYAGPCDLCVHVATQPELRRIADDLAPAVAKAVPASTQASK
jgi:hypothetical protein